MVRETPGQLEIMATLAMVVAIVSVTLAAGIVGRATYMIELQEKRDTRLRNEFRLWQTYVDDLRLEVRGGPPAGPPPEVK